MEDTDVNEPHQPETARSRDLVVRHFEAFVNQRDLDAIDRNMTDDFLDHDKPEGKPNDRAGDRAMMAGMHRRFHDLRIDLHVVAAEGDIMLVRAVWTGTDASTGKTMSNRGFVQWRIAGDKLAERWATVTPMRESAGEAAW